MSIPFPNRKWMLCLPVFFMWSSFFLFIALFVFVVIAPGYGPFGVSKQQFPCIRTFEKQEIRLQPDVEVNFTMMDRDFFDYMAVALRGSSYPGVEKYIRYAVARSNLVPLANEEPLKPGFGPVINDVTSFTYPITIPRCPNITENPTIFVAVISAPNFFGKRKTIRNTWKNSIYYYEDLLNVGGFAFIVGLTDDNSTQEMIEEESRTYGDIIQIGIDDFYRNLATKMTAVLNWVHKYCERVDYILKADDDVYVNAYNLVVFTHTYIHQSNYSLFGAKFNDYPPHRGKNKWAITYEQWPWKKYPTFSSGPSYILPGSAVLPLLAAAQTIPLLPFEDVYLLGLCAEKAQIKIRASSSVLTRGMPPSPPPCELRQSISWLTTSNIHMNKSHMATEQFYQNLTQCVIVESNGLPRTVDFTEPVQFSFVFRQWKKGDNNKKVPDKKKGKNPPKSKTGSKKS